MDSSAMNLVWKLEYISALYSVPCSSSLPWKHWHANFKLVYLANLTLYAVMANSLDECISKLKI
jgi:hypothetical protein